MPTPVAVAPLPVTPTAPAAAKPVAPTAAAVEEAMFEITVDGKPAKYTRKQLEKFAGKGAFADRLAQQAKEALRVTQQRQAEIAERDALWDDEDKLAAELEKRGKLDAISRKRLAAKLNEHEMTEDQKNAAAAQKRAEAAEKERDALKAERDKQALTANAQRIQQHVEGLLDAAWERAGFERGADAFHAVYEVMAEWNQLGILPKGDEFTAAFADRVIDTARENIDGTDKRREAAVLKGLKGKSLVDRLGKTVVDEVLRYKVEELRGGGAKKAAPSVSSTAPGTQPTFISPQEAMKKMRGAG